MEDRDVEQRHPARLGMLPPSPATATATAQRVGNSRRSLSAELHAGNPTLPVSETRPRSAAAAGLQASLSITAAQQQQQQQQQLFIRRLGRGAFGQASLYRREDGQLVVIKEIDLEGRSSATKDRCMAECKTLSCLQHPNIVAFFDVYESPTTIMIEMEYADGGDLREMILRRSEGDLFPEDQVLWLGFQLLSALAHVHDKNIIHRDVKTENIFLTKTGWLKLGDFGIAALLQDEEALANTVVGTPYYMAPEIFQNKPYNTKTDIFAAGCVLHEVATLQRTFNATNIGAVMFRIIKQRRDPLSSEKYSQQFRDLVDAMLEADPAQRPMASDILSMGLMEPLGQRWRQEARELHLRQQRRKQHYIHVSESRDQPSISTRSSTSSLDSPFLDLPPVTREGRSGLFVSKEGCILSWGAGQPPSILPFFHRKCPPHRVSAGPSHFAVVTKEGQLYTWCAPASLAGPDGHSAGQLGHGNTASYRQPRLVTTFPPDTQLANVSCGDEFTVAQTDSDDVFAFGSNYAGFLGLGDEAQDTSVPLPIPLFSSQSIACISCGAEHTLALTRDGNVWVWGSNEFGQLGTGDFDDVFEPRLVTFGSESARVPRISAIVAGPDCSCLITETGGCLFAGNNQLNKLGLDADIEAATGRRGGKNDMIETTPTFMSPRASLMTSLSGPVREVAFGQEHTAVLTADGEVLCFGDNSCAQHGSGDTKSCHDGTRVEQNFSAATVAQIACGDRFTVVLTSNGHLYGWGKASHMRLPVRTDASSSAASGRPVSAGDDIVRRPHLLDMPTQDEFSPVQVVACASRCLVLGEKLVERQVLAQSPLPPDFHTDQDVGLQRSTAVDDSDVDSVPDASDDADSSPADAEAVCPSSARSLAGDASPDSASPDASVSRTATWLRREFEAAFGKPREPGQYFQNHGDMASVDSVAQRDSVDSSREMSPSMDQHVDSSEPCMLSNDVGFHKRSTHLLQTLVDALSSGDVAMRYNITEAARFHLQQRQ